MKYLSICSGIEAASVAWHTLGWTPVAFAETEAFPRAVLAQHYPHVPNLGDINHWKEWPDAAIDVLVGGTPCQSFSVAGLRGGMADPRGNLALVYLAIADRYRPQWVVWENVPGVLSSDGGRDFGAFIGGLAELGYHAAWRVLDAQYVRVDGYPRAVPQRRRRVFVVGYLGNWRRAAAVLFERESLQGHPAPRRQSRERIAPTISSRPSGGGGLGTDFDLDGGLIAAPGVANPLTHRMHKGVNTTMDESQTMVAHSLKADGFDASEDGTGRGTPLVPIAFSCKDHGADADDTSPTLRAMSHDGSHANGGGQVAIAFDARQSDVIQYGDRTGPLDTDGTSIAVAYRNGDGNGRVDDGSLACAEDMPAGTMRGMREGQGRGPPRQRRLAGQRANQPATAMPGMPHQGAQGQNLHNLRREAQGSGLLQQTPSEVQEVGRSVRREGQSEHPAWAVRRLTPTECERLQGFPDGYTLVPYRGKPASGGPRYKALGNSMAVNCMRWLGRRIERVNRL